MKNNKKKIVTAGVTGMLAAGLLVGSVDYASHMFQVTSQAATVKKTESTKKAGNTSDDKQTSKNETVYINMDANGEQKKVTVSDWLKNVDVNGTLKDTSDLKDIENVKGDEKFTQNGKKLDWNADSKDIYYQGTTDKETPVDMQITYKLDGKEISAQDLLGKSGKLEMHIQYTNNSYKMKKINGKETKIYTPFVMVTGMILPTDTFNNVTINHGNIVSEGDNQVVIGYGVPGLKDSLNLGGLDFGKDIDIDTSDVEKKLTDSVTIKADVTDFEISSTYTVATAELFNDIDFGNVKDLDDVSDKIDELTDNAQKLLDGGGDLEDGMDTLASSFKKYAKGVNTLGSSVGKLKDGGSTLKKGVNDYTNGADKLLTGVQTYADGSKSLAQATNSYLANTKKLTSAIGQLRLKTKDMPKSYKKFGDGVNTFVTSVDTLLSEDNMKQLSDGTSSLKDGVKLVDSGLKSAQTGVTKINTGAAAINNYADQATQTSAALKQLAQKYAAEGDSQTAQALAFASQYMESSKQFAAQVDVATNGKADGAADGNGAADLAVGLSQLEAATNPEATNTNLYTGAEKLETSAQTFAGYAKQLRDNSDALLDGNKTLSSSIKELSTAIGQMDSAGQKLVSYNSQISSGANKIIKSTSAVKKNSKKLSSNSSALRKGAKALDEGMDKLKDGVDTLVDKTGDVTDGISKLKNGASKLSKGIKKFNDKGIDKISDLVSKLVDNSEDLSDRVQAISDAADEYKSFSGADSKMDSSVKFIMATDEVEKDD